MANKSFEVSINPEILRWVRESDGWDTEEISKKIKMSKENYEKIESGNKLLTFRQLEMLANYFKRPVSVFFLSKPPEEPSIMSSFRILPKSERDISKDLRLVIRKARYYQSISNNLMLDLGIDTKAKITPATIKDNPQMVAQEERKRMGISIDEQFKWKNAYSAFNTWRDVIESSNILVFQFNFPIEDARGFCLMDKEPPIIAINSNDNVLARIFTLFHEYAHTLLGITEIYTEEEELINYRDVENWCNSFVAEFLIPESALKEDKNFQPLFWFGFKTEILQEISNRFKVSKYAILNRLRTLNLIDNDVYKRELLNLKTQYARTKKKSGFASPTQKCLSEKGKKFIYSVLQSKEKGLITTADAIEYLSIKLKQLGKVQEII